MNFFLKLQIKQTEGIHDHQTKYVKELIKKFDMEGAEELSTLVATSVKLDHDLNSKLVDSKYYRSVIGTLLYLAASKLDILFAVDTCARYRSCTKESHLIIVKRVMRYLKEILNVDFWHPRVDVFKLVDYSNSNFTR